MKTLKKLFALLLSAGMILTFTACGNSSDESSPEEQAPEEQSDTEASSDADSYDPYTFEDVGFSYELPDDLHIEKGSVDKYEFGELIYGSGVYMGFPIYYDMTEEEISTLPDDKAGELTSAGTFVIICVKGAETAEEAADKLIQTMSESNGTPLTQEEIDTYSAIKEIHKENGYMWLVSMRDKFTVRKECQAEYDAFYDASEDIINNHMKFFAPAEWEGFSEDAVVRFETVDLDGNPVKSEDLFAKNKVTMINLWATYCGPCINEMPEIEKTSQEFASKGGGVIGIVTDVFADNNKYLENAQTIVKETGVTYPNVRAWDGYDEILEHQGTPTTYFVDSEGKLIGAPILGAQVTTYPKEMEELLSQME